MSLELLDRESSEEDSSISPEVIGQTVFEKLAIDAHEAAEKPEAAEGYDFTMSTTRHPDGQTVPDE